MVELGGLYGGQVGCVCVDVQGKMGQAERDSYEVVDQVVGR